MTKNDPIINTKLLLEHIQGMRYALELQIKDLRTEVKQGFKKISSEISHVHRLALNNADSLRTIDTRLDDIEIEELPKRVAVLEKQ